MEKKDLIVYNWQDIENISRKMAKNIAENNIPDIVIGITRGGNCFATLISEKIRKNMYTLCVTRRKNDIEIRKKPKVTTYLPKNIVNQKSILLVDEIVVTGETLDIAKKYLQKLGATKI